VVRTRVGYAGGDKQSPTYQDLGDHSEAIEIDFDPAVISYRELLDVFWQEHSGTARAYSRQYAAFVFANNEEQVREARASKREREKQLGQTVTTPIRSGATFWRAEDYHQKFRLRHDEQLTAKLIEHFGSDRAFVDSTAAARLNGLRGGNARAEAVEAELRELDVPDEFFALAQNR
jgi:methionine-S-sulfoxide reductase